MMEVMSKARSLARLCAGVILIHHSAKNGVVQARGNTAIGASTDMAFIVEKTGNKVEITEERFRFCAGYTVKFEMDFGGVSGKYSYKLLEERVEAGAREKAEAASQVAVDKEVIDRAFAVVLAQYNLGVPVSKRQLATMVGITSSATRERVLTGGRTSRGNAWWGRGIRHS